MTIEAQKPPRTLSGFDLRGLGAIIAVGFILRLGWALSVHSGLIAGLDMQGYYNSAKNLADGYGLTVRRSFGVGELAGPGGVPSLAFPPGYSLTLAGVFRVFGDSLTAGKLLNVVAGTLTIPLVYCLALRWYGRATALVAAALFAAYPANIFWTSVLYSDLVFTLPFALALVLLVEQDLSPKNARMVAFGIVLGYATIIRPQALVLLIAAVLYFAIRTPVKRQVIVPILAAILGVAFCVAPIAAWNTHRAGRFVLLSESLGYNLRIGNSPNATGGFTYPQDLLSDTAAGHPPTQAEAVRRSVRYAVTHPVREAGLSAKKVYFLYITDSGVIPLATTAGDTPIWGSPALDARLADLADIFSYVVVILVLVSIPVTWSRRDRRLLPWIVLALWTLIHIVFFGEPRYHLPVLIIMIPMAARVLVELPALLHGERPHEAAR